MRTHKESCSRLSAMVCSRMQLRVKLQLFSAPCQERPSLQATHIFDGLESWPTHLMYLASGHLQLFAPTTQLPEVHESGLLALVEK